MTPRAQMTNAQERRFYREVVQASLEKFYGKSQLEAKKLVRDWWRRLSESGVSDSGLFLHAEPINTAAGIAEARVVQITEDNRAAYHRILNHSRDLVLVTSSAKGKTRSFHVALEKMPEERLVHLATSGASSLVRSVASKALARKATNKKAAAKQQVALG
jgi:hypothetical protein